jgi:hypothetical protein
VANNNSCISGGPLSRLVCQPDHVFQHVQSRHTWCCFRWLAASGVALLTLITVTVLLSRRGSSTKYDSGLSRSPTSSRVWNVESSSFEPPLGDGSNSHRVHNQGLCCGTSILRFYLNSNCPCFDGPKGMEPLKLDVIRGTILIPANLIVFESRLIC